MNHLNDVAGREIEITFRAERSFTFSFDGIDRVATDKIVAFFKGAAKLEVVEDEECGTFIYCEA